MTGLDQHLNASAVDSYSLLEKYIDETPSYRISQRTIDREIQSEGGKDMNPNHLIAGLLIGFLFIILFWPIGLMAFIITGIAYVYSEPNKLRFVLRSLDDKHCDLSVSTQGEHAAKTARTVVEKVIGEIDKPEMMKEISPAADGT